MAVWYCGSVQHAAVAQFAISTAYTVGQIVRQLATPAVGSERCFRCTTAGTSAGSEPSWSLTKGATTTSGTATFTEVTGNSTYGWSAPFARINTPLGSTSWLAAGDTLYVAHDHASTQAASIAITNNNGTQAAPLLVICVNASGSVPPVSADLRYTASEATTGDNSINFAFTGRYVFMQGISWSGASGANTSGVALHSSSSTGAMTLHRCNITLGATGAATLGINASSPGRVIFKNTTVTFGAATQSMNVGQGFEWKDTASALGGATFPTTLIGSASGAPPGGLLRGVDLSALGSGKTIVGAQTGPAVFSLVNCKLGGSVTVAATPSNVGARTTVINSDSGATGYVQQDYQYGGTLTTETTHVLVNGASDGVQAISWKVVTNANTNPAFAPFECFQIAEWNAVTGSPVTATIEIENAGSTLSNSDVWMEVEYLGSASYPVASVVSNGVANILAAASNLPSSSASWNGGLGSAVKQYLTVTFTPQMAGLVRATIYVGKASQTVYIDPKLTLV